MRLLSVDQFNREQVEALLNELFYARTVLSGFSLSEKVPETLCQTAVSGEVGAFLIWKKWAYFRGRFWFEGPLDVPAFSEKSVKCSLMIKINNLSFTSSYFRQFSNHAEKNGL